MAKDLEAEIATLRQDYATLQADLQQLMKAAKENAGERLGAFGHRVESEADRLRSELAARVKAAADGGGEALEALAGEVERHPVRTLAFAFLAGIIAARLLDR
jgi:ElaB/YqjD/DUF883 family membrane-anchored ribosome-binding protein